MVREIIQYPTPLGVAYATDVRVFDEELFALIADLKDTINENNLEGLAAFQIGNYYNVVVVKDENGAFLELINPRLIAYNGKRVARERTAYYPNVEAQTERYEEITVVYQDRNAKENSLKVDGDLSLVIQRKIDYTFGATFIHKMSKEERARFEKTLGQKQKSWLKKFLRS
jgi:peptide deformylase